MNENLEQRVGRVLDEPQAPPTENQLIELSSGVILRPKRVPILLMQRLNREFVEPLPPKVYIPEKEREEYNYQDPAYLQAVTQHEQDQGSAMIHVMATYGTEVEFIPEGVPDIMDPWDGDFEDVFGDIISQENDKRRYYAWLTCIAIHAPEDLQALALAVQKTMGVSSLGVADKMQKFPGDEEFPTDLGK